MTDLSPITPAGNGVAAPALPNRFRLWTVEEICEREPPPWLVGSDDTFGVLPEGQLTVLFGPSGHGKSFTALDLAFCVAAGIPAWNGFPVKQGPVIYVAAEGAHSLSVRVPALLKHYQMTETPADLRFITSPVNLHGSRDLDDFIAATQEQNVTPALIVIDTLARCMLGGDENTVKDMAVVVANADRLKDTFQATVLIVHHSGKSGDMRGSTALLGAVDKQIGVELVKGDDDEPLDPPIVRVTSAKTKDGADFKDLYFRWKTIPVPTEKRPDTKSAVLVRCPAPPPQTKGKTIKRKRANPGKMQRTPAPRAPEPATGDPQGLRVVLQAFADLGPRATRKDAEKLSTTPSDPQRPRIPINQFNEAMRKLVGDDDNHPLHQTGKPGTKSVRYSITETGQALLADE